MIEDPRDILNQLRDFDTATVCNAIERLQIRDRTDGFMGFNIRCLFPEMEPMVGYAVTATVRSAVPGPPGSRSGFAGLFTALEDSPSPAVLVFKDVGPNRRHSCHFGDMMATICQRLGAIGLVTDGGVRDLTTVKKLGFHYFTLGPTPSHGNYEIVEAGLDINVGGTVVQSGGLIHADENGMGVFPADRIADLLEAAHAVRRHETERMAAMIDPNRDPTSLWI